MGLGWDTLETTFSLGIKHILWGSIHCWLIEVKCCKNTTKIALKTVDNQSKTRYN